MCPSGITEQGCTFQSFSQAFLQQYLNKLFSGVSIGKKTNIFAVDSKTISELWSENE